jgi:GT2 family glycosyltransferase
MPASSFEVLLVDDGNNEDTASLISEMVGRTSLNIRCIRNPVRRGPAAARNVGWRATDAPVVAFTDDDCVPDPKWLAAGLSLLDGTPKVVVGRTSPPPDQERWTQEPFSRHVEVSSTRFFESCNIFYRREDLLAVEGFDERFCRPSGEDTHLGLAVTDLGVEPVFASDALVHHDVRRGKLFEAISETFRWVDLPLVVKGRVRSRRRLLHRWIFWRSTHPPTIALVAGLLVGFRFRVFFALGLWWVVHRFVREPVSSHLSRRIALLPGTLALDVCEVAVMIRGSLRHRTVLL